MTGSSTADEKSSSGRQPAVESVLVHDRHLYNHTFLILVSFCDAFTDIQNHGFRIIMGNQTRRDFYLVHVFLACCDAAEPNRR